MCLIILKRSHLTKVSQKGNTFIDMKNLVLLKTAVVFGVLASLKPTTLLPSEPVVIEGPAVFLVPTLRPTTDPELHKQKFWDVVIDVKSDPKTIILGVWVEFITVTPEGVHIVELCKKAKPTPNDDRRFICTYDINAVPSGIPVTLIVTVKTQFEGEVLYHNDGRRIVPHQQDPVESDTPRTIVPPRKPIPPPNQKRRRSTPTSEQPLISPA